MRNFYCATNFNGKKGKQNIPTRVTTPFAASMNSKVLIFPHSMLGKGFCTVEKKLALLLTLSQSLEDIVRNTTHNRMDATATQHIITKRPTANMNRPGSALDANCHIRI